jgi:hypothetical protein
MLSVMTVQTVVSHHLYQNDQFCGFVGSSGPSQVTTFGSALILGRMGSGAGRGVLGCGGPRSCGSSLTVSKRDSLSRSALRFDANSSASSCMIVDVEACTIEGAVLVSVDDEAQ